MSPKLAYMIDKRFRSRCLKIGGRSCVTAEWSLDETHLAMVGPGRKPLDAAQARAAFIPEPIEIAMQAILTTQGVHHL